MEKSFTDIDMHNKIYNGIKNSVDPDNIFGANNTIYKNSEERKNDIEHEVILNKK